MSHLKERAEKNCLNCNAEVHGKYCHICGQENIEPFETVWHLVSHFFQDITHFDGKFFSTLRYLLFKPGFLSREYMIGRRASYLNPIRMYVFTSAFFFLLFFTFFGPKGNELQTTVNGKSLEAVKAMDSTEFSNFTKKITGDTPMTRKGFQQYLDTTIGKKGITFATEKFRDRKQYDSLRKAGKRDDNWLERKLIYKQIDINEKYKGNQEQLVSAFINALVHTFPQILFISLPIFALILKLLYWRKKAYYYGSHAIFSIQFYIFIFIDLMLIMAIDKMEDFIHSDILDYLKALVILFIFYYEYKSMRAFYEQGRGKTILKFILLNLFHLFVLAVLLVFFTFFSLMKI